MAKTSAVNLTASGAWQYGNAAGDAFAKEDVQNLGANADLHNHTTAGRGLPVSVTQRTGPTVGTTGSPTQASASFATIPEMTVTLTTTGGELDVDMMVAISHSSITMASTYGFSLDGAAEVVGIATILGASGDRQIVNIFWTFTGVSAAAHTVTGRWNVNAGTVTAVGTQRWIRLIERKT